ncbi:hypothetical protein ACS0TY_021138 [Phlomoides rotata]
MKNLWWDAENGKMKNLSWDGGVLNVQDKSVIVDSSEGSYQVLVDFVMRYSFYTALTVKVGVDNLKIYQLCAKYLSGVKDEATEIEITKGCCVVHHALGSQVNQSGVEFPFASYRFWVTRASWISKESIMVWTALLRLSPLPTVSQQWKSFAEINRRGSLCNYLSVSYIRFSISLAKYSFTFMVGMLRDMLDFVKFDYVRSIVHKCIIFFMDNELSLFSQLHLNVCARNFVILYRLFAWCCLICSEVHVEGLETLDYFDNLSQRERYSEQAVAITFDTEVICLHFQFIFLVFVLHAHLVISMTI